MSQELGKENVEPTRRESVIRVARQVGSGTVGLYEDWSRGVAHAATGGRLGMTIPEARQLRREESGAQPISQDKQE